jgi:glucokinase
MEQKNSSAGNTLGLDIGGTEIKAAVVNGKGDIIASHRASTPVTMFAFEETIKTLSGQLHLGKANIRGVGVGCKGIIDPHTTEVLALPGELNYLQGRRLSEILGPLVPSSCPVAADNDARVALIGEHQWGTARGRQNAIMLTLGTGVGGAILSDGKIMRGAGGVAGHLGHVTVDPNGALCICGNRGCLETVFSARAIEAEVFAAIHRGVKTQLHGMSSRPPTCSEVFDCAQKGDEVARIVVERATLVLGSAIAGLIHILDPEIFCSIQFNARWIGVPATCCAERSRSSRRKSQNPPELLARLHWRLRQQQGTLPLQGVKGVSKIFIRGQISQEGA